jgi:hypothetical protein
MAEMELGNKCKLEISPIFDKSFTFVEYNIKESILGELPEMNLILMTKENLCEVNDEITGHLTDQNENKTYFNGYVYSINFVNSKCEIKILCVKPKFVRVTQTNAFESMNSAIENLCPYPKDQIISNTRSNLMDKMELHQTNMDNYHFLKKCLIGYKKNTIYGFALGSLRINDLSNWNPKYTIASLVNIMPLDASKLTNSKLYSEDSEIIDYSNTKDPYHEIVKFYDEHVPINKEYKFFIENVRYNSRFMTSKIITNYETRELFPFNITDSVNVEDTETSKKNCFITSRKIEFKGSSELHVFYTIQSINPLGE